MINQLNEIFKDFENCHISFVNSFYLKDSLSGKCQATLYNDNSTCLIEKADESELIFVAIDECLITSLKENSGIKRCDAVVFNETLIWFIELKEVQFSGNSKLDSQKKKNGRKKAVKQLASTINFFKNNGVDLSNHQVASLMSFPPYIDEVNPINIPQVASQARLLEYINLCGYTDLFDGNHIVM